MGILIFQGCNGKSNSQYVTSNSTTYVNWSSVKRIDTGDSISNVSVAKNYVYYTGLYNGLSLTTVSSLDNIKTYNRVINSSDMFYNVVISSNIACVAVVPNCSGWCFITPYYGFIYLYDLTDIFNPIYLSSISIKPDDMLVDGNYLYATSYNSISGLCELNIIDISNPTKPMVIGTVNIDNSGKIAKRGNKIFISQILVIFNNVDNYKKIQSVDVTNPFAPILEGQFNPTSSSGYQISNISVVGDIAYVGDMNNGLYVVDISDTQNPKLITSISQPGTINSISQYGNYLYLGCMVGGVRIYDISNPKQPVLAKVIASDKTIRFVSVTSGKGVYVTDLQNSTPNGQQNGQELNIFYINQ
jgi:hypothetical protein